jgi:TRAP-type transport system periplasmic protein
MRKGGHLTLNNLRRAAAVSVLALAAALPLAARAQSPIVMKLGTATINDSQHEWMKRFAAAVEADSKGRIKGEVYPASQLGSIPRMIEQTQFGSIQGWIGPPEFLSGVDIRYEILSVPGLFKDTAHANRTLQDPKFNAEFLGLGGDKGLKGVGLFISGPMAFVANKPLKSVADLAGMKIRVLASPMQMEQVRALKATPVPMALGEVLPALQQGTLDSVMTDIPVFTTMRFYSVSKYLLATHHSYVLTIAVLSKSWVEGLPADLQKLLADDGRKVSEEMFKWAEDDIDHNYEDWTKAGGEIVRPDAAARKALLDQLIPIGREVASKNPGEKALYDVLQEAAKRTE